MCEFHLDNHIISASFESLLCVFICLNSSVVLYLCCHVAVVAHERGISTVGNPHNIVMNVD